MDQRLPPASNTETKARILNWFKGVSYQHNCVAFLSDLNSKDMIPIGSQERGDLLEERLWWFLVKHQVPRIASQGLDQLLQPVTPDNFTLLDTGEHHTKRQQGRCQGLPNTDQNS